MTKPPVTAMQQVDEYFSTLPKRLYPKGHIIIFAGENPEGIFYITKGRVRKYDVSYRGDEIIVNVFQPPAFFPMSWAFNRENNQYFYKAETEIEVRIAPVEDALEFVSGHPDVMADLLSRLYRGTDGLLGRMVHLMSGTAKSRMIYELAIECRRFGEEHGERGFTIKINEGDLASRSGLSRETISREMSKLKAEGLVNVDKKQITVIDLAQLEKHYSIEM